MPFPPSCCCCFATQQGTNNMGPQASCGQPFWRRPPPCVTPPTPGRQDSVVISVTPTTTSRHLINRQTYSIVLAMKVVQCVGAITVAHADTALLLCLHQAPPSPHPPSAPATRRTAVGGGGGMSGRWEGVHPPTLSLSSRH